MSGPAPRALPGGRPGSPGHVLHPQALGPAGWTPCLAANNGATLVPGLTVVALVRYPRGQGSALVLQPANVASIGLVTVLRYVSYRRWVFPAAPAG